MTQRYEKSAEFREQDLGDEIMVFDDATDQVHVLNTTAKFVWSCLVEPVDVAMLEERLREAFEPEPNQDVAALAKKALDQLVEKGLVRETA